MNIVSNQKSKACQRAQQKKVEKRRKQEKVRRRKNALRRVLDRRGKPKRFDPRNDIPPTLTPHFKSVYAQIVVLITNPVYLGSIEPIHVTRFFKKLERGDVLGVAGILQLYSNGGTFSSVFSSEWTFFNKVIRIRKPNSEELRMSECASGLYDTFYRLLAERLVKNRKKILQLKRDNLSAFRKVIFSLVASLVALIWLISVLSNPAS